MNTVKKLIAKFIFILFSFHFYFDNLKSIFNGTLLHDGIIRWYIVLKIILQDDCPSIDTGVIEENLYS